MCKSQRSPASGHKKYHLQNQILVICFLGNMPKRKLTKSDNRQCLLRILSNIRFLSRQDFAFRGDADEVDSNFVQLLKLRGQDDPRIEAWLSKKTTKYTSNNAQMVMALSILRKIAAELSQSQFFVCYEQ